MREHTVHEIPGPKGTKFNAVISGSNALLTNAADPNQIIIFTGVTGTIDVSISGILGGIGDKVMEVLGALKSILGCNPVTTTTVNVGPDGKITSVTTTTKCAT